MKNNHIKLSTLGHTWILDLDGTICKHNGYKIDGHDTLLDNFMDFYLSIPPTDLIIIVTSRTDDVRANTIKFLSQNKIRYDYIIFNAPLGERILINDNKPSGLICAKSVPIERDNFDNIEIEMDSSL